jgi:uncharacterized protein YecT (DUF1311 family)
MMLLLPLLMQAADPLELDCDDPQVQVEMNLCALRDYEQADAALNEQWDVAAAVMKARDKAIDEENDRQPGHYQTLLEGQRAWLKYRDAQCLAESFMARGGSMQPMLDSGCRTYLTELRTQQLGDLVAVPKR